MDKDTTAAAKAAVPKKKYKVLRGAVVGIAFILVATLVANILTPVPASLFLRMVFSKGITVAPNNYANIEEQVTSTKDLAYPSAFANNTADLYLPKNAQGPLPVVLWVHGGGFVGGDKRDIEVYATCLASKGIAVACINYERAPEATYPTPITQTAEAYEWLTTIAQQYSLDMQRLVLTGDSAGAHIVAQFSLVQTNASYAHEMSMDQIVPPDSLRAVLLFCGPFEVTKISEGDNALICFLLGRAGWAYFGASDWAEIYADEATIGSHVSKDFPATFITDGNTLSFEEHGRTLAAALADAGVSTETYFIPLNKEAAIHEYQFIMNTPASEESFALALAFIEKHTEHSPNGEE